jgi:wyosine [tRNA(Phe)-imidazoG37] synthetase (radical SAM superfamily)
VLRANSLYNPIEIFPMRLTTQRHDRDNAGMTYVYPVVSRRAQGVSIGINLNPNNACNWRCIYCQVPDLKLGKGPTIDLALLSEELDELLESVVNGDFMESQVPEGSRRLNDIAYSGNGEPTSSPQFAEAITIGLDALKRFDLSPTVKPIVITNGSVIRNPGILDAISKLGAAGGETWFKLDRVTAAGIAEINSTAIDPDRQLENLRLTAGACSTWIQTCMLARDGEPPAESELNAYLDCLRKLVEDGTPLQGVLLYGLERQSHQPEASQISALPSEWLIQFGQQIEDCGLTARVHP